MNSRSKAWNRRDVLLSGAAAATALTVGQAARSAQPRLPKYIVDSQSHVWLPGGPKPNSTQRQEPFSYQELLGILDAAGVARLVIVTPSWNPTGNAYPLEAAKAHPSRFHVMGLFNFANPPSPEDVANWKKQPGMLGMRMFLASPAGQKWLSDGSADWLWPIMEREQIPLMIFCYPALPPVARIAAKYPGMKIILDSFAIPTEKKGPANFAHYEEALALAKYPNIAIKCESVPFLSAEGYPYRDILQFFKPTYDAFGPERMFWGSDMTLLKPPLLGSYMNCIRYMTEIDWMTDRDLELIMGRSLSKWLNWPLPA
ncbi:MAG TPA: amidohydrolase family protein [Stellaceae bacterium]|jgi:predicted TIM-barrel fold metal-dependent hydrolase|nr:amidohydrolase family protein [Stellaceae bacterium]